MRNKRFKGSELQRLKVFSFGNKKNPNSYWRLEFGFFYIVILNFLVSTTSTFYVTDALSF